MQASPRLVGRTDELAQLERPLAAARAGRGAVVLLAGEAGVGKTRLAEQGIRQTGFEPVVGRAREEATPSYGPIASVLRDCMARFRHPLDHEPLTRHLALLLPELGPAPTSVEPDVLVEAILGALATCAQEQRICIFLDDVHWADNATLELLPRLAERIAHEPLAVVAAYRSDEIVRNHPVRRLRNDLRRARLLHEIQLEPLSMDATASLLEDVLEAKPASSLVDLVQTQTHGVPLYVEELARALVTSRRIQNDDDGVTLAPGETVPIPESVRDAVLLRLDGLSSQARGLLDVAAVVGVEFDLELVAGLAGGDDDIEALFERHLVVETAPGRGAFRHALVHEAIRGEIVWSRRRALHRRIAAYLERAGAPPEHVAEHWLAAREHAAARQALLDIAERSCRLHAYRDAARAAHRALELWPEGHDEPARVAALERLAHCAQVGGQLNDAARALREAAESPAVQRDEAHRARVLRELAGVYGLQGAWEQALDARARSAEAFERAHETAEAAIERLAAAARHTANSALERALESVQRARALAESAERRDLVARAIGFEGNLRAMQGDFTGGRELAEHALALALESGKTDAASEAYRRLASVLDYSSNYPEARDAYGTAVDYCRAQGAELAAHACMGCMAYILYRTGEWKRAMQVCRDILDDASAPAGSKAIADLVLGILRSHRGEARSARKSLQSAMARARSHDIEVLEFIALFALAGVSDQDGERDRARRDYEQAFACFARTEDRHDVIAWLARAATFHARAGDEAETTRCAESLATIASSTGNPEAAAALAHALGEVAWVTGDFAEAARQLEQAAEHASRLEVPYEQAESAWRAGVALVRCNRRPDAVRQLTTAYRLARKLGARPLAAAIAQEMETLGERVEEGRRPDSAAHESRQGLTRRQVEIARLMADGHTNKEIAGRLFVSTRTVDMHVSNILDRLDCRSRTEAAKRLAELGLLDRPSA